jgi:RNA polymerase sigma-70 factor (ECF subfamily)
MPATSAPPCAVAMPATSAPRCNAAMPSTSLRPLVPAIRLTRVPSRGSVTAAATAAFGITRGTTSLDEYQRRNEIDQATLLAARRHDHAAFAAIVAHYDVRLRSLAFHLLKDAHLTDDAMQDAYVKAYKALPAFREESALGTWLYRITYTTCLDYLRRGGRVMVTTDGELPIDEAAIEIDPADELGDMYAVVEVLHTLPLEQRATVLLVGVQGFEYAQAAEILDVPVGTVASRMAAARTKLRKVLEERRARTGKRDEGPEA